VLARKKIFPIASLVVFSLIASTALASEVEWKEKKAKVDENVSEIVVNCFGIFPSIEYKSSPWDMIVVKCPKQYSGKGYSVDFKQMGDTLQVSVIPEGHKASNPDDVGSMAINALQIVIDLIKMSKGNEYPYFVIELPERFREHVHIKPVL